MDAPTMEGYKFLHWWGEGDVVYHPGDLYRVEDDYKFIAVWEEPETPEEQEPEPKPEPTPEPETEKETPEETEVETKPEKETPEETEVETKPETEETKEETKKETSTDKNPSTGDMGVALTAATLLTSAGAYVFTSRKKR